MKNRQVICKEFGPPESLIIEEREIPLPKEEEVLVKLLAAGVGYVDSLTVQGLYQVKPLYPIIQAQNSQVKLFRLASVSTI